MAASTYDRDPMNSDIYQAITDLAASTQQRADHVDAFEHRYSYNPMDGTDTDHSARIIAIASDGTPIEIDLHSYCNIGDKGQEDRNATLAVRVGDHVLSISSDQHLPAGTGEDATTITTEAIGDAPEDKNLAALPAAFSDPFVRSVLFDVIGHVVTNG